MTLLNPEFLILLLLFFSLLIEYNFLCKLRFVKFNIFSSFVSNDGEKVEARERFSLFFFLTSIWQFGVYSLLASFLICELDAFLL